MSPFPISNDVTTQFQSWLATCTLPNQTESTSTSLRDESRALFLHLSSSPTAPPTSTSTITQDLAVASSSTPNGAMAQLVSILGPALSDNQHALPALHCLMGAAEGSSSLTHGVRRAVGQFLVRSCDTVGDSAVSCLGAMLKSRLELFPTGSSKGDPMVNEAVRVIFQSAELRLELAVGGMRSRCGGDDVEEELSRMPRSQRSVCFLMMEDALDGFDEDIVRGRELHTQFSTCELVFPASVCETMGAFASLTSSCLNGETDPRCLIQLLRLLNKVQRILIPCFNAGADHVQFPSTELFDAVAPYYPVHFTPPKQDPHGITRDMLHDALMGVLCEKGVSAVDGQVENMSTHAVRLFMERLDPKSTDSSEHDPPEVGDKLEAIKDLSTLFFSSNVPDTSRDSRKTKPSTKLSHSPNVIRIDRALVSELSSSLARVHEEAVSFDGSDDGKSLASAIRKFSSSLAYSLESCATFADTQSDTHSQWDAFVLHIINRLAPALASAPQGSHGRASTVYLASLAAGAGLVTLNKVLEVCIPRFLEVLSVLDITNSDRTNKEANVDGKLDEEKIASALRGIAAMISSCRVALEHLQRDRDVRVHPHPLAWNLPAILGRISLVLDGVMEDEDVGLPALAAVGALESLLTSINIHPLQVDDLGSLEKIVSLLKATVQVKTDAPQTKDAEEWKIACARTIGALIAGAFGDDETYDENTASCTQIGSMVNQLIPQIVSSAISQHPSASHGSRYDWIVLSKACSNGSLKVSSEIVSLLLSHVLNVFRSTQLDCTPVMAFSYIVRHGGPNVAKAFHMMDSPDPTPIDVINELCKPCNKREFTGVEMVSERTLTVESHLELPASPKVIAEEKEAYESVVVRAYSVLPLLREAFESPSAVLSCESIVQLVGQVLPPLSRWDKVKLCVSFPLLAAVLSNQGSVWKRFNAATMEGLKSMTFDLAKFSLSSEEDSLPKSAAASCLFSILRHVEDESNDESRAIREILNNLVFESLVEALPNFQTDMSIPSPDFSFFREVEDAMNFMSLLGTAAACKGGLHSKTADAIAIFLIEMACIGTSLFPFSNSSIELIKPSDDGQRHPIKDRSAHMFLIPASAFGSMLSVHNGSPFWRQRIVHKAVPILMTVLQEQAQSQNPPALGSLTVTCHMLCDLPEAMLGESNMKNMVPTLVAGLVYFSNNLNDLAHDEVTSSKLSEILGAIIVALVKLLTLSPDFLTKFISVITPSLLQVLSSGDYDERFIPNQLLVLQCLTSIVKMPESRETCLRERQQVVTGLAAMLDHPSVLIRHAVVQVRNTWYTL